MAVKASRPVRTLAVFLAVIAIMFGTAAGLGSWKPKLGLDLRGGTAITLQAKAEGNGGVTAAKLNQAVTIITERVNGAGVSEAQVSTQGNDVIVVQIPGKTDQNLEKTIGTTAQLRFRLVKLSLPPAAKTTPTSPASTTPTAPSATTPAAPQGSSTATTKPRTSSTVQPPASTTPKKRPGGGWLAAGGSPSPKPAGSSATPGTATTTPTQPTPTGSTTAPPKKPAQKVSSPFGPPPALEPPHLLHIGDPLTWAQQSATPQEQQQLASYRCPGTPGASAEPAQIDLPSQPLLACDSGGTRYLLSPAIIEGKQVTDAFAGIPQSGVGFAVNLKFDGAATRTFADLTQKIYPSGPDATNPNTQQQQQFAIVLDGQVLSAPVVNDIISNGQSIITGNFTQQSANNLANSLKYGALPLSFVLQGASDEGPELAGSQLDAGILAGIIGLLLVVGYCLLYYRGLGFVVISSLVIAGLLTYAAVLLLGHAYGFTLTLPGIAGLIVAVGITADSFIVYFERLRDEVRDGKTLRTSVETGWSRARHTILAADGVTFMAALVLYIFAIGDVKGFAFTLGLTTVMDVFVVFFFTKPMLTLLARTQFFGHGHKLSGLDREHLGLPALPSRPRPAGGGV